MAVRGPTLLQRLAGAVVAVVASSCQFFAELDQPLEPSRVDGGAGPAADGGPGGGKSAYATAVLADGPILYLRFSEAQGARVLDLSPRANHLSVSGAFQRGRTGLIRGDSDPSVGLSGGAQLLIGPEHDFALDAEFTWEIWVRLDRRGEIVTNVEGAPPNLKGTALYLADNSPQAGFERWSNVLLRNVHAEGADVQPGPGGIFHLVVVNTRDRPRLFINGTVHEGYRSAAGSLTPAALVLGKAHGDYDELAIYDKALPDTRVVEHYALGRGD